MTGLRRTVIVYLAVAVLALCVVAVFAPLPGIVRLLLVAASLLLIAGIGLAAVWPTILPEQPASFDDDDDPDPLGYRTRAMGYQEILPGDEEHLEVAEYLDPLRSRRPDANPRTDEPA